MPSTFRTSAPSLKRRLLSASSLCLLLAAGCGSSKFSVSDSITPTGPLYLDTGQTVTFTATVKNDPLNQGVVFTLQQTSTSTQSEGTLVTVDPFNATYIAPTTLASIVTASVLATPVANPQAGASAAIFLATAPAITTTSLANGSVGTVYSANIVTTGGTAPAAFKVSSGALPAGLTLSPTGTLSGTTTTATITGTPTTPGTYTFTVSDTDSASTPVSATATYTIVVNPAVLSISTNTLPSGVTTQAYSTTLTATGGTGADTFSLYSGSLPAGLTLSTAGVLSGTPMASGTFTFTAQVTDSGTPTPQVARKTFTLTVYGILTITTTSLPNGSIKNAYNATITSTGGNGSVSYSLVGGTSLPAGLSLSPTTGAITGTPTATGSTTFTVQAGDTANPQQTATAQLTINIVLSTLAITTTSLPQVTVNSAYSQQLTSSGGNPPVTWALAAGSAPLPAGLFLSSAGVISGTPTTVGMYSFTVQASDATPASVTQTLSINVVALTGLNVTTTTLPAGNIGTAYSATLAATGGATPYTWTLPGGALPAGLTLATTGVISGTPYVAGTSSFTVQVKDSQATQATATKLLSITIGTTLAAGPNNNLLSGSYAFLLNGFNTGNTSGKVYGFASIGSLAFNAAGAITGTEDTNTPAGAQQSVAVTGTYTLGADNRGFMVLTAGGVSVTYTIAASSVQFGLAQTIAISEFDNSTGTGANATGFARRQTATAFATATLNGSFTFGLQGESPCSSCTTPAPKFGPVAAAGFFTGNTTGNLATGTEDASAYGSNFASIALAGTFTTPSATTGRGTLLLTPAAAIFAAPPVTYTYVIVSAGEMLLMSVDSHATTTLLYGDALLQQNAPYTTASFTGKSVGYESQAAGGDGSVTFPTSLNAILSVLVNTAAGTATLEQDANRAGTLSTSAATAVTYTVANGRAVINSTPNQVVYFSSTGAGFGIDLAPTSGFPALLQYELQVNTSTIFGPALSATLAQRTLANPVPATTASGSATFTLLSGGVDTGAIGGRLVLVTDSDSPAGTIGYAVPSTQTYVEDITGRGTLTQGTTAAGVVDVINAAHAVSIPGTSATSTTPVVTIYQ